jgi:hypothetical protein
LPATLLNLSVYSDTMPRAAAIAAVLTRLMEREAIASTVSQSDPSPPKSAWTEERRQRQSEQMKAYWQRKHTATVGEQGAVRP